MDLYSRLYRYRDRQSVSPMENFTTEGLSDLFNRLPPYLQVEFLLAMLPGSSADVFKLRCDQGKRLQSLTQVSVFVKSSIKRPDIIIYIDDDPLLLIEVKLFASVQEHRFRSNESTLSDDDLIVQSQLKTYLDWIADQNTGAWPGAVVFLTHGTIAPADFERSGEIGVAIGKSKTWKNVGDWLTKHLDLKQNGVTHCALAAEFCKFLEKAGLMTEYATSRDLAATAVFMRSYAPLEHTIRSVVTSVVTSFPKTKGGNLHVEFWQKGNSFCGWYYLNKALNPPQTRYTLTVGICFPDNGALEIEEPTGLPSHDAFFFVAIGDDWGNKKASAIFKNFPEGWIETNDDWTAVIAKPTNQFSPDPDLRAQEVIEWAKQEVGRAMKSVPEFEKVPIEQIAPEVDS